MAGVVWKPWILVHFHRRRTDPKEFASIIEKGPTPWRLNQQDWVVCLNGTQLIPGTFSYNASRHSPEYLLPWGLLGQPPTLLWIQMYNQEGLDFGTATNNPKFSMASYANLLLTCHHRTTTGWLGASAPCLFTLDRGWHWTAAREGVLWRVSHWWPLSSYLNEQTHSYHSTLPQRSLEVQLYHRAQRKTLEIIITTVSGLSTYHNVFRCPLPDNALDSSSLLLSIKRQN